MSVIGIIGGGASGIALARALDKLNKKYVIYEARQMGATWSAVPSDLSVLSPWWTNILDVSDLFAFNPFGKPAARKYFFHLKRIANQLHGKVFEMCTIERIELSTQGTRWALIGEGGQAYFHDVVVIATGYFFSPALPNPLFDSDTSIPIIHASKITDYAELDQFLSAPDPLLIVGGRVTAGQLMLEMDKRKIPFDLSVRSEIAFRRHGLIAFWRESIYFIIEEILARIMAPKKQNSYPGMDGGKTQELIASGVVGVHPAVRSCLDGVITFINDSKKKYSAVVLATGYHPCLRPISGLVGNTTDIPPMNGFEIAACKGLYLLGFDNLYDHRSRYLRGIRGDAKRLARML